MSVVVLWGVFSVCKCRKWVSEHAVAITWRSLFDWKSPNKQKQKRKTTHSLHSLISSILKRTKIPQSLSYNRHSMKIDKYRPWISIFSRFISNWHNLSSIELALTQRRNWNATNTKRNCLLRFVRIQFSHSYHRVVSSIPNWIWVDDEKRKQTIGNLWLWWHQCHSTVYPHIRTHTHTRSRVRIRSLVERNNIFIDSSADHRSAYTLQLT